MVTYSGGKAVYGASVGVLMLETQFPRVIGDLANAQTWPFAVQYRVVKGVSVEQAICQDPRDHIDNFIRAGRTLIAMGCDGITTSCGFLALIQDELKEALSVPVVTSSLMQVPMAQATLPPGQRVGILTISAANLTRAHLDAAKVPVDTPIVGLENGREFSRAILNDEPRMDYEKARQDLLDGAAELVQGHKGIGAIVLECTNMVPFAADIRRLTGLPVYSIYSLITWFQAGLAPRRFPLELDDPRFDLTQYGNGKSPA